MFTQVVEEQLAAARNILLMGMGGGYDVFAALPLYFGLKQTAKTEKILLANLTFTRNLEAKRGRRITPHCLEVRFSDYLHAGEHDAFDARHGFPRNYFPEFHLSKWFHDAHHLDTPVYALAQSSVDSFAAALSALVTENSVDALVLVDAGVDSVLKGDEEQLGTFAEDLLSLLAVQRQEAVPRTFLMCVGLGTEGGVSEYDFFENLAAIQRQGGFLGSVGWQSSQFGVRQYLDAIARSVPTNTTINQQIVAALEGMHGQQLTPALRERGVTEDDLYINPLMTLAWFFDVSAVLRYRLFMDEFACAVGVPHLRQLMKRCRVRAGLETDGGWYQGPRPFRQMFPPKD